MGQRQEEADLILRLYEIRRDAEMRKAREWYDVQFNPQSAKEILDLMMGSFADSTYFRMALTYWEMVAALVSHGAIDAGLLHATNVEHMRAYAKIEPYLAEIRDAVGEFLPELEKLAKSAPDYEKRMAGSRAIAKTWFEKRKAGSN